MIRFGVIGTNMITEKLLDAGFRHDQFKLTAVYSRTEERAKKFAREHQAPFTYTSIEDLAQSDEVDAVYIASPNSFHAEQAKMCMKQGKHVLCEKPMASNSSEVASMIEVAKEQGVLLMEAVKSTVSPNFTAIQQNIEKVGRIRRYVGNFCKYSSRYDAYKQGNVLNAFNPEYSNGSLMDLGVYGVYPMVVLFGAPDSIKASGVMLDSGVDGEGSLIAHYGDMEGVVMHSKIIHSYAPSEIQGEKGTIMIPNISEPKDVRIIYNDGSTEELENGNEQPPMYYEIEEFIDLIIKNERQSNVNSHDHSLIAAQLLEESRKQMGLVYPADR